MHGDFSRLTFLPANHFSAVLSQQGRVQLDAEDNEARAIETHYLRTLITDLLGPAAGPSGPVETPPGTPGTNDNGGFEIEPVAKSKPPDVSISFGRYYVDGLLCENDPAGTITSYWDQPDAYLDPDSATDRLPDPPFLVYLLVWERLITAAENPAIREVALGDQGPDTAVRAKIVWQVRAVPAKAVFQGAVPKKPDPGAVGQQLRAWLGKLRDSSPMLRARTAPPDPGSTTPCITPPQAGYRGLENQLYRVEVCTGNGRGPTGKAPTSTPATFTWSRENGSVVFPILKIDQTKVFLATMGRDTHLGLEVGDWVEIVDEATALSFGQAKLLQVTDLSMADRSVTLSEAPPPTAAADPDRRPMLRRWDQREPEGAPQSLNIPPLGPDNALQVQEGDGETDWIDLENGIQIQFQPPTGNPRSYWRGDYWLIPARTLTNAIEWPDQGGAAAWLPPHGVRYHVAPLAIINPSGPDDVRCLFDRLKCT
jgi:hypothetical protein